MRIIFAGTPDFSVPALKALIQEGYDVVAVYTQPDRKTGRGQKITHTAVKKVALEHDIPVFQPTTLKTDEAQEQVAELNADTMVVVAYGMILPKSILDTPKYGCLNIHGSLLPRWRGAAPIQRAIQMGDDETGICIMQMDVGLDTGDVLHEERLTIESNDTTQTLHDKLSALGASCLISTLNDLSDKQANAIKQDDEHTTYAEKISKAEGVIDWNDSAQEIDCRIRAFNPWPVCETKLKGQRVRVWMSHFESDTEALPEPDKTKPGQIVRINENAIEVACGEGFVQLTNLQREGSKAMPIKEFINGFDDLSLSTSINDTVVFGE